MISALSYCRMPRKIGARLRQVRRLGTPLPGLTQKSTERKPYPPGQRPVRYRRTLSNYALQLNEKQKLRMHYGVPESQFRNYVRKAMRTAGSTTANLPVLLEHRLDNVVFRLGWAPTIVAARQIVGHGHIQVNHKQVNIPSFHVSQGDSLSIAQKSLDQPTIAESLQHGPSLRIPSFLKLHQNKTEAECIGQAVRDDIPVIYEDHLVIEFYATKI